MWRVTFVKGIAVASVVGGGNTWDARETSIAECWGVEGDRGKWVKREGIFGGRRVEWTDIGRDRPKGCHLGAVSRVPYSHDVSRSSRWHQVAWLQVWVNCRVSLTSEVISSLVAVRGWDFMQGLGLISLSPSGRRSPDNRNTPPITFLHLIYLSQVNYPVENSCLHCFLNFDYLPFPGRGGEQQPPLHPPAMATKASNKRVLSPSPFFLILSSSGRYTESHANTV